ncbi:MAG: type II toxin-antitoxin system PemK/MazF family toxin [Chloroflexi bacterium]|nr:MAG: PemK family transcriptional regulator [Anaerolineaceae bacterium 4572_32.2]RLC76350.1 MAG: type II toxin-antitoxin system PemK/MazF family toxin [Chloroflexota bacterium]RLC86512.1 MAG: type II toxin-antitoxin system PemK/MazF family toxin [Chloroflexota bacterium]HEY73984.1 type II toxin-antitoxin system PemK/MazF family toxin [Thermoflexia bacterium]
MRRGDVYDARLSPTEGSEQAGVRPVIIVSRDAINRYSSVIVIVPLTRAANIKRDYPSNVRLGEIEDGLAVDSVVLGGQVRAIAKSRLLRHRGHISTESMRQISKALRITLDL